MIGHKNAFQFAIKSKITIVDTLRSIPGILTFFLINIFLIVGISSQINYYEKKAIDQRVRYTQKQCAVLSNQIVNNGFRN